MGDTTRLVLRATATPSYKRVTCMGSVRAWAGEPSLKEHLLSGCPHRRRKRGPCLALGSLDSGLVDAIASAAEGGLAGHARICHSMLQSNRVSLPTKIRFAVLRPLVKASGNWHVHNRAESRESLLSPAVSFAGRDRLPSEQPKALPLRAWTLRVSSWQ